MSELPLRKTSLPDEPPPILGSWRRLYAAVLVYLLALITAFWAFERAAAP